jgi:RNA polymerase sigma factor (sigma-70 family)
MRWQNRAHGRDIQHVPLDAEAVFTQQRSADFIALDQAMSALEQLDPRKVKVVELRFFGGLSIEETAAVLNVSAVTVRRDWSTAKVWLYREMAGLDTDGPDAVDKAR